MYNLARARFSTGDCTSVKELLEQLGADPGQASEIKHLKHELDKGCKRSRRQQTGFGRGAPYPETWPFALLSSSSLCELLLGAFAFLLRELDDGAELPVAFVEHEHAGGPALYEYRPLVRAFVEERASRLRGRTMR